ncbi:MAG: hypothetical protein AAFN10_03380 [Bacteroidota bacterium]
MNESLQILVDGFTYRGHMLDIAINYVVLALCLLPYFFAKGKDKVILGNLWVWIGLLMAALQIWIWFEMNESGISLIWSALAGLNILLLVKIKRSPEAENPLIKQLLWASLIAVLAANLYYAITLPPITTIAHIIALLVGMAIYGGILLLRRGKK